jgi:hypothetical protein
VIAIQVADGTHGKKEDPPALINARERIAPAAGLFLVNLAAGVAM